ncbi:MAG TPA: hypothetical protein VJS13_01115 [Pyrinomonadaceae bacterium]|nr:hypothetical protein [Pyrinomonadaceae bacterium]
MKLSKSAILLTAVCVFLFAPAAQAQSHEADTKISRVPSLSPSSSVQLGDKVIVIPSPEGYEEGTSQFPQVKDLFTAIEAPVNDTLLAHLPVSDCTTLRNGGRIILTRYTKVSVLKTAREQTITDADMTATVAAFRQSGAKMMEPDGPLLMDVMRNAEKGLSRVESREVGLDVSETQILGEFDVRPQVYSVMILMIVKVDSQGKQDTRPVVLSLTYLKVRQRMIYVSLYQKISSAQALKTELKPAMEDVKQVTTKWVNEILAANREVR